MPKRNSKDLIVCGHFSWRLFVRNGVYYADGRRAANNVGKHSLSTRVHAKRSPAFANWTMPWRSNSD